MISVSTTPKHTSNQKQLKTLHKETTTWGSELEFMKVEHGFFEDVMNNIMLDILPNDAIDMFEYKHAIHKSEKRVNMIIGMVKNHESGIEVLFSDTSMTSKNIKQYNHEHEALQHLITNYTKNFNRLKNQVFAIAKRVKKEEKYQDLIRRKDKSNVATP